MCRDLRREEEEYAAHPPTTSLYLVTPTAAITHLWAPMVCVVSIKGYIAEGERAGLPLSLERCLPLATVHYIPSWQAAIIFSPCLC